MSLKVYFPYGNPRGTKVLVAADLANVKVEHVDLAFDKLKSEEHVQRHPLGKVPALQTPEGYVFESNAILRYIARANPEAGLYGESVHQQALVDQWLDFAATEIEPVFISLVIPVLGYYPLDQMTGAKAHADLVQRLRILDNHLKANNFLVGTRLTIADVELYFLVAGAFKFIVDEANRKNLPNLVRWFDHVANLPQFLSHFGRPRNCKHPFPALQITAPQPQQGQQQKQAKPQPEKKPQQQQQQQPKPQKKEEKKEEEEPVAKKEVNPLEQLPPSTFNLDDWKRRFLAAKDQQGQRQEFEWFWQNFDDQGWSCWEVLYDKDPNEGKQLLKTSNTMKGFLQRTDQHFRKYAFAMHGVYGEEPDLEIRGAWMWRGAEIPAEMKDHPSYEFHRFNKIDKTNEEQRKLFEDYWLNQTEDESVVKGLRARVLVYFR